MAKQMAVDGLFRRSAWVVWLLLAVSLGAGEIALRGLDSRQFWTSGGQALLADGGQALKLTWQPNAKRPFMECNFLGRPAMGTFQRLNFQAEVAMPRQQSGIVLTLRLIDNQGEIFQFNQPVPVGGGKVEYTVDVQAMPPFSSWGGKVNKKLDFPVHFLGLMVRYPQDSPAGELTVNSLSYQKYPEERECVSARLNRYVDCGFFQCKSTAGAKRIYQDDYGIDFGLVDGGQFRMLVRGGKVSAAELQLSVGKSLVPVKAQTIQDAPEGGQWLLFPVGYYQSVNKGLLQRVDLTLEDPAKEAQLQRIRYEHPAVKLELAVGKGSAVSVWHDGVEGAIRLRNPSSSGDAVKGEADLRIEDESGAVIWKRTLPVELAAGAEVLLPLSTPKRYGLYWLKGTLPTVDGEKVAISKRFAYMSENAPMEHGGMQYGIALMTWPLPVVDDGALGSALAGCDFIRSSIIWMNIQPRPDEWHWEYTDGYFQMLQKHNLRWAPILWCPPRWATAKDWKPSYPPTTNYFAFPLPDYELWDKYVAESLKRYGEHLRVVEVWNEPELPGFANFNPEEYAQLLKRVYSQVQRDYPHLKVTTCGYTCLPGQHPKMTFPDFMPRSLKAAAGHYDYHAIHLHSFFAEYRSSIQEFLQLRREWGVTVPWAANETAMTATFCSRLQQAQTLFQKAVFSQAAGAVAYVWHNLRDLGRDRQNKEHNFGLFDHEMAPKEAYLAFNTVTRYFRDATYLKEFSFQDCFIYAFKDRAGQILLPMWTLFPPAPERLVVLEGVSGDAYTVDIYGNRQPLKSVNGRLVVAVGASPQILVLEQPELPRFGGEAVVALSAGRFQEKYPGLIQRAWGGFEGEGTVAAKRENGILELPVELSTIRKEHCLKLQLETTHGAFTLRRYISPEYTVEGMTAMDGAPLFRMESADSYTGTSPFDPSYADCFWKGAQDCSGEVWLGWSHPGRLHIKVRVKDDRHWQDKSPVMSWQGDGLQLFFSHTGTGGMWKLGFALDNQGKLLKHCWLNPRGYNPQGILDDAKVTIRRDESAKITHYDIDLPASTIALGVRPRDYPQKGGWVTGLGITPGKPFRFNLMINDNDGRVRVGYHSITQVVDDGRNDQGYPSVTISPAK